MKKRWMSYFLVAILFALAGCKPVLSKQLNAPPAMPHLMLWVWEYPTDLSYINPKQIGVATLIASCNLQTQINCYTRHQPLWIPVNTYQLAVIRLQSSPLAVTVFNQTYATLLAQKILEIYKTNTYQGLQIDFDATSSLRPFYSQLLIALRAGLNKHESLSITALGSWCVSDRWMERADLPIDYAVPMLYDLDSHLSLQRCFEKSYPHYLSRLSPYCRGTVGLATYSSWQPSLNTTVPVFVFTKGPWHRETVSKAKIFAQHY